MTTLHHLDNITPAINARIIISRVDMDILDSPASTTLVVNPAGVR
jgi:hypothetical protein